jgi:Zn-dependent alcohol dehydrogenase
MRSTEAAVLIKPGERVQLTKVDLAAPQRGEVVVEIAATGVCHSDLSVALGLLPNPLPVVLGHEGAGTIVQVGDGVTDVAPGDRVVLSWLAQCGTCFYCAHEQPFLCDSASLGMVRGTMTDGTTRFSLNGQPVYHMAGLGTFSRHCVVAAAAVVKLPDTIAFPQASLIGCGVLTGFGAAANTAAIKPGETVAVIGCGGVGLNAIQGARVSGASQVLAIDLHDERLELGRYLGATRTLKPGPDLRKQIRALTDGRGVDVAIEVVGRQETVQDAIKMKRRGIGRRWARQCHRRYAGFQRHSDDRQVDHRFALRFSPREARGLTPARAIRRGPTQAR